MHFQSVVINVANLDRSVDFYSDVFDFTVLSSREQIVALSDPNSEVPQVIVLRAFASTGRTAGANYAGMRALTIETETIEVLDQIDAQLQARKAFVDRLERDDWVAVVGFDPDYLAMVAICSREPGHITNEHWRALDDALFRVGE